MTLIHTTTNEFSHPGKYWECIGDLGRLQTEDRGGHTILQQFPLSGVLTGKLGSRVRDICRLGHYRQTG